MLVIRFLRVGKRNQPAFKIVVTDKRRPPQSGKFVEQVGFYNPLTKEKILKKDRIQYWLSVGAQPSDTVHNLLVEENVIEGEKTPVHKKPKKKKKKEEKPLEVEKPKEEKQKEEKQVVKERKEEKMARKAEKETPKEEEEIKQT